MSAPVGKVVMQGLLGWVRKGAVEVRYFVLRPDSLDYYYNKEEADKDGQPSGRLLLDDMEELDVTETGFMLGLEGDRKMELKVMEEGQQQTWLDALTPFFENDSEEEEGDEVEEEVVLDAPLVLEIQGKRQQKHFWLFNDRLEYTETEDDQVPQDSFPLERLVELKIQDTGFELNTPNRILIIYCQKKESKEWIRNLQQAYEAHMAELRPDSDPKMQLLVSTASPTPSEVVSTASPNPSATEMTVTTPNNSPVYAQRPPATEMTVTTPADATGQSSKGSTPSITPFAAKENDASQATRQPLHQGELGVFRSGSEETRYFVLFPDTLEYWSTKADFLRGDRARGYVVNASIINLEVSDCSFTVFLDTMNQLELRCKTLQVLDTWLVHWSSILGKTFSRLVDEQPMDEDNLVTKSAAGPTSRVNSTSQDRIARNPEPPMQAQPAVPPKAVEVVPSAPQLPLSPLFPLSLAGSTSRVDATSLGKSVGSTSRVDATTASQPAPSSPPSKLNGSVSQPTPDLPGLIFMGSLVIDSSGKLRRRHFALFDNRLDYFATPSDVTGDRYPKGRILLRDITALDVLDDGFQLNFSSDMDVTKMVLVVDPSQLQLWLTAWNKTSLMRGGNGAMGSPTVSRKGSRNGAVPVAESKKDSLGQPIKDALIEGQLGLIRQANTSTSKFSGKPEARYFVLFPDRLDCFIDEANAVRGRPLESVLRQDIEDIDVVQGGFNIASVSRSGRPLRLRALPGVQPSTEKWIEAFKKAFSK